MSAAARAEARRKAILSRGTDRLAKLTTSARGEDAPAYMHDDPPLPNIPTTSRNFLGEESSSNMPPPYRFTPSPSPSPQPNRSTATPPRTINPFDAAGLGVGSSPMPDPSVWSPEQQQQFMQALMGAAPASPLPQSPLDPFAPIDPSLPPMDNPLAMLFQQGGVDGAGPGMFPPFGGVGAGGKGPPMDGVQVKEPTKLQKVMPLLHMLAMWCLLAYFVLWVEPKMYEEVGAGVEAAGMWRRWAELGRNSPLGAGVAKVFRVQLVPFFWAFTTIQIILHSLRIFSGFDAVQPPALLALALPHLPPPIPSIIVNVMKYMQMGSLFLDDLAGLVVGIGFIVYFAGLLAG